jgi:hypothetical protein
MTHHETECRPKEAVGPENETVELATMNPAATCSILLFLACHGGSLNPKRF